MSNTLTTTAPKHSAKATASAPKIEGDGLRRTPYHQREAYIKGDTPKKAKIIRSVLNMGCKVTNVDGEPVTDARSNQGMLETKVRGHFCAHAPIFIHPGK